MGKKNVKTVDLESAEVVLFVEKWLDNNGGKGVEHNSDYEKLVCLLAQCARDYRRSKTQIPTP